MKRLRNSTDIPDALVRHVADFVMPPGGLRAWDLELRNTAHGATCGRAYWHGSGYHTTVRPFVVVRVSKVERWRGGPPRRAKAGYLPEPAQGSRLEQLVHVLAHELRHLWQARVKSGRRVWGSRGRFSERDADAWALHCLRRWRREAPEHWTRLDRWRAALKGGR